MRPFRPLRLALATTMASTLLCSCHVQKTGEGPNSKVDIKTPVGSVQVDAEYDPAKIGLAAYPGARRDQGGDGGRSVQVAFAGSRVLVFKYRSDDAPAKVLDFYRKELGRHGTVTECQGSLNIVAGHMICSNTNREEKIHLVSGEDERRRVVSVKPDGRGSTFTLLFIQSAREKEPL